MTRLAVSLVVTALTTVLATVPSTVLGTASTMAHAPVASSLPTPDPGSPSPRGYSFVAAPDFLNQDVGDVRGLPGWDPGEPTSWTPELEASMDVFLDEIAATDPRSVLVTGDLVGGHWGKDTAGTGIFGDVSTPRGQVQALRRAGDFYHSQWAGRFRSRGLTVHAAVGDHELGDNPWAGRSRAARFKREQMATFKQLFARHHTMTPTGRSRYADRPVKTPWADTAYAVRLSPEVLLVTVDVFNRTADDVRAEVVGGQLSWLRNTLRAARARGVEWILVQGHTPVATPVRTRSSSSLILERGTRSPMWRVMRKYGVDLYLAGEVHDTTLVQRDGITQISTGGLLYAGTASYLGVNVHRNRLTLDLREFSAHHLGGPKLWETSGFRTRGDVVYEPGSHSAGRVTLTRDGRALHSTGKLIPYRTSRAR
ncbi:metallophosphoesterase family protein [Nocardioides pacificus]